MAYKKLQIEDEDTIRWPKREMTKGPTIIYIKQHRKSKIEHHETQSKSGLNTGAPER